MTQRRWELAGNQPPNGSYVSWKHSRWQGEGQWGNQKRMSRGPQWPEKSGRYACPSCWDEQNQGRVYWEHLETVLCLAKGKLRITNPVFIYNLDILFWVNFSIHFDLKKNCMKILFFLITQYLVPPKLCTRGKCLILLTLVCQFALTPHSLYLALLSKYFQNLITSCSLCIYHPGSSHCHLIHGILTIHVSHITAPKGGE